MPPKILLIDDEADTRQLVTLVLRPHNYELKTAATGREGVTLAESEKPDLILLDIMMPDMNGYEVCRQLRALPELAATPILMFTAKSNVRDRLAGMEAGADEYLTKPTSPEELLKRVRALLATTADRRRPTAVSRGPLPGAGQPLAGGGRLTAVLGARGGAGTTTVAINLAVTLADSGHRVALVDLDMVQGHVGIYLNQQVYGGLNALAELPANQIALDFADHATRYEERLHLYLARPNLDRRLLVLTAGQSAALVAALGREFDHVVADLGRGLSPAGESALDRAGRLIVCVRPERPAITAARVFLRQLPGAIPAGCAMDVVMLDFGSGQRLPRPAVEDTLGQPLAAELYVAPTEMAQAVNRGLALVRLFPDAALSLYLRQLVEQVET